MANLKIELVKSLNGRLEKHIATAHSLGLRKIGQVTIQPDNTQTPVADMLKYVDSRYLLVNVVAQRARQIAEEAEELQEDLPEKPVTMAIREVADGKLSASLKEEYTN